MSTHPPSASAFDHAAPGYDAEATDMRLSRFLRSRVWARLERAFSPGSSVIELGCGTGEDALWLARRGVRVLATDASAAMLDITARKAREAGLESLIETRLLDLGKADTWDLPLAGYDGAFSNYGPLNCIGSWRNLGGALAKAIRPGGQMGLAVMGPFCLWESLWHGLHGDLRTAARRWSGRSEAHISGVSFPVYYPTPGRLMRELGPEFKRQRLLGFGVFVPPSDLYAAFEKRRRSAQILMTLEKLAAPIPLLRGIGDHYWLELERR